MMVSLADEETFDKSTSCADSGANLTKSTKATEDALKYSRKKRIFREADGTRDGFGQMVNAGAGTFLMFLISYSVLVGNERYSSTRSVTYCPRINERCDRTKKD